MTIITAIYDGKSTWLGNNSASTIGDTPVDDNFDPWIKFSDWALGVTGDSFQQDFLTHNVKTLIKNGLSAMTLTKCIRDLFLDNYISESDTGHASPSFGISCILVNKDGSIWNLGHRLALTQISPNKVWANGSGVDYSLGADFAIIASGANISTQERIEIVTQAAIKNDVYCPGKAVVSQFS